MKFYNQCYFKANKGYLKSHFDPLNCSRVMTRPHNAGLGESTHKDPKTRMCVCVCVCV